MKIVNIEKLPEFTREQVRKFVEVSFKLYQDTGMIPRDVINIKDYIIILDYDLLKNAATVTGYWKADKSVAKVFLE